jgi:hypothetical protein
MAKRSIVDVGKFLQKYGLNVGENPAFGGVGGGHSPTGYHPTGEAIDVRDWRPDVAPAYAGGKPIHWKQRTGEMSWRAKQLGLFNEALGPGDKGHDTHVHLALQGQKFITDPQLEWLATGRYKTPEGKLTDVMPGAAQTGMESTTSTSTSTSMTTDPKEFLVGYLLGKGFAGTPKESAATQMKRGFVQQLLQPADDSDMYLQLLQSMPNPYVG